DAVQAKLTAQWSHRTTTRNRSQALLRGLLFDDSGYPMRPTHATKNGVRYRYYVSQPCLRGITAPPPGAIARVPAAEIETAVVSALKAHLRSAPENRADQDLIASSVSRIEIHKNELAVRCKPSQPNAVNHAWDQTSPESTDDTNATLSIPWCKPPIRRAR